MTSDDGTPERDQHAVQQFIERFAAVLAESGFPRMPARVFVTLLATDSGQLTAAELAERLQVSPAAISGAVRYLVQVNLASREREPGSRRDHYRVYDDAWYEATVRRDRMMARWNASMHEGINALGQHTRAGQRLTESLEFFTFIEQELPHLLQRWRTRKDALRNANTDE